MPRKGATPLAFIPPKQATDMPGMWQRYYTRWKAATREQLDPALLEVLPPLAKLCPPATVIDKTRYSAFVAPQLFQHLQAREADGLIVTGSETDVCVLATVLGAVDLGYRVILVRDAVCSSSDEGHDALLEVYHRRYTEQIETAETRSASSLPPRSRITGPALRPSSRRRLSIRSRLFGEASPRRSPGKLAHPEVSHGCP